MVSLLIAVVLMAIVFDYINGFHDAANAIATVVSTGVLPIRTAVLIAAVLNFVGALTGHQVAKTIATGLADPASVTQLVVLGALLGASAWNLITWWFGIPSSSSHALVGALAGSVVAHAGVDAFKWRALTDKILVPLVASPTIGFIMAFFLMVLLVWLARGRWAKPVLVGVAVGALGLLVWGAMNAAALGAWFMKSKLETQIMVGLVLVLVVTVPMLYAARPAFVHSHARRLQLLSATMMAYSHGSNDAQKSMGIITLALLAFGTSGIALPAWAPEGIMPVGEEVPRWVMVVCAAAIAFGTAAGGTRIIKTMGTKIIRIAPIQGFAAETAGALTILTASQFGIPVSTTHVINACIMGVGASKRVSAVRWGVATNILIAWVVTLPFSAGLAWVAMKVLSVFLG